MTEFRREGDEILIQHLDDPTSWGHHCFFARVAIVGPASLIVGTPATYRAEYLDWQGNPLTDESRPICVRIARANEGQLCKSILITVNEVVLQPENGVAEFDVQADYVPEGGKLTVEAVGDNFGCDPGRLEVDVIE